MRVVPHHVISANLSTVGHQRGKLYVRFNNGACYEYEGVAFPIYQALIEAESVGKYFNQHIQKSFKYTRLTEDPFADVKE